MSDERTVWYRKWRPQTFAEVTGQEHVTRTLRNAVAAGRVAHAYLLAGPRGTGKTTTARVLAKAVNCTNPREGEPCDRCDSCVAVREGRALDLVEMDAASNRGIDDIRELRERVGYAASGGRFKVYLIDEVHELTQQAFDALLKTLEEPPPHVVFVLATTDAHRVPATIVSRCQRFDLVRARIPDLVARLGQIAAAEDVEAEDDALALVARAATGSFRDAVGLLEQLVASYGTHVTAEQARAGLGLTGDARALDLARLAIEEDLAGGLALIAAVRDDGVDLRQFTREVVARLRSILLLRAGVEDAAEADPAHQSLAELAQSADIRAITHALKAFGAADFRADPQASLPLELALVEVALRPEPIEATAPTFAEARQARRTDAAPTARPPAEQQPVERQAADRQPTAPRASATQPDTPQATPRPVAAHTGAAATPRPVPAATSAPAASDVIPRPASEPADAGADSLAALRQRLDVVDAAAATPAAANPVGATHASPLPPASPEPSLSSGPPASPEPYAPLEPHASSEPPAPVGSSSPSATPPAPAAALDDELARDPAAAIDTGPLTLPAARARYREVYQRLRDINRLAAHINPGDIIAVDDGAITFGLPYKVQVDKLAPGSEHHRALEEAVAGVFGRRYAVHCLHMKDAEDRLRAQPTKQSHLLDEALKLGARPLSQPAESR